MLVIGLESGCSGGGFAAQNRPASPVGGGNGSGSGYSGGGSGGTTGGFMNAIYGSGINTDALSNIRIGPYGGQASYRFLAAETGTVAQMRPYLITVTPKPGYEAGTGGTLLVQVETDDGSAKHEPSGTVLGSATLENLQAGDSYTNSFPTMVFTPAPQLQAGTLYHVVFTNIDPDPGANYVSVDDLYMTNPLSPMEPAYSDTNFAVLEHLSGDTDWWVVNSNTPILEVDYADGGVQGNGYMEAWPEVPEPIGGASAVRETFTVSGPNTMVSNVALRLARIGGSGDLTVKLEQSDGTVIEQGTIPAGSIPLSNANSPNYVWANYQLSALRTLFSGQGYNLEFDAPDGTTYQAYPVRKGSADMGFNPGSFFNDGYAEFNQAGAGWVGWSQWGVNDRTDSDLQFYFTVIP